MQTFLPYADFSASAEVLDRARLGKQRVETLQIMTALMTGKGWTSHPATLMWRKYEWALLQYQGAICKEWRNRAYSDTCLDKTREIYEKNLRWTEQRIWPHWLGDEEFHLSHQSNLVRKDPDHYRNFFLDIDDNYEYVWPEPMEDYKKINPSPWWNPPDPAF